jgi:hypothetical protein
MATIKVISRRRTVYGPARTPIEVEATPRVRQLIKAGVFTDLTKPSAKVKEPKPVTGVTAPPAGTQATTSVPLDHEGAEATP